MNSLEIGNFSNPSEALEELSPGGIFLQLQGRLGNQLFGLSEAWRLHRTFNSKILIDLTPIFEAGFEVPDWLELCKNWDWMSCMRNTFEFKVDANFANLGQDHDLRKSLYFRGFRADYEAIEESGLFKRGIFPPEFQSNELPEEEFVAVSIRLGDYSSNHHLGILPLRYYERAQKEIPNTLKKLPRIIFSDDLDNTSKFLKNSNLLPAGFQSRSTALKNLEHLASAKVIIGSNSTFSFWGSYLSSGLIFSPKPFYLGMPEWHNKLIPGDFTEIRHTIFPKTSYKMSLARKKMTKLKEGLVNFNIFN